jgi:hypothetical protein
MGKRAPVSLVGLCVGLVALVLVLSALFARESAPVRGALPAERAAARPATLESATIATSAETLAQREDVARTDAAARTAPAPASAEPAALAGRLELDGAPPLDGARVHYHCAASELEGWTAFDAEGRFRIAGLAPGRLTLAFALPSPNERVLLLPEQELELAPGQTRELALVWRTKQVNVRVDGDLGGWNRARVHLTGPGYDADFETGDGGKAELALVGSGSFVFRAEHRSGMRGEATLELDAEAELESLVIPLAVPVPR